MAKKICALLLAGLLAAATTALLLPASGAARSVFGYRFLHVLTRSMQPALDAGDMVVAKPCKPEKIREGDMITINAGSGAGTVLITHRVVEILTEWNGEPGLWFITKGDANLSADPPVEAEQLVGKAVLRLRGIGNLVQNHRAAAILICVLLALCGYGAAALLVFLALRRHRKNGQTVES